MRICIFLIISSFFLSSCATIISGNTYPLSIRTEPAGATVTVTNKKGKEIFTGKSPAKLKVKSGAGYFTKAQYFVKLNAPGYAEKIVTVNFKFNGWYVGNLAIGGALGMIVIDPLTGAMWRIADPVVDEKLEQSLEPILKIISIADMPEDMKSRLVKL